MPEARRVSVNAAVTAAALALAAYQFAVLVSIAATQALTFDGAMNLRAAEELFRSGRYGSYYDGFRFFPPEIQTGLPVQIPAGFFVHLLGKSPFAQNLANLLSLAGTAAVVFALIRGIGGRAVAAVAVALFFAAPGLTPFPEAPSAARLVPSLGFDNRYANALGGYGELPALFFGLLALLLILAALRRAGAPFALLAGLAAGASFATKTIALMWCGPLVLLALAALRARDGSFRRALPLLAGAALPPLAVEAWKFAALGDWSNYLAWWRIQSAMIWQISGAEDSLARLWRIGPTVSRHMEVLALHVAQPVAVVVPFLIVPWLAGALALWRRRRTLPLEARLVLAFLLITSMAYFVWFLGFSPTEHMWLRRILNGLVLQVVLAVLVAHLLWRRDVAGGGLLAVRRGAAATMALLIAWVAAPHGANLPKFAVHPVTKREQAAARFVAALPREATIFGWGWGQSPMIDLLVRRGFEDINNRAPGEIPFARGAYLVVDQWVHEGWFGIHAELARWYRAERVYEDKDITVYRLTGVAPMDPPVAAKPLPSRVDFRSERATVAAGLYELPGGRIWMRPQARIALGAGEVVELRIALRAPESLFGLVNLARAAPRSGPPRLTLRLEGCEAMVAEIPKPGPHAFRLPLRCAGAPPRGNVVVALELDRAALQHVFLADGRSLGLELLSIEIVAR